VEWRGFETLSDCKYRYRWRWVSVYPFQPQQATFTDLADFRRSRKKKKNVEVPLKGKN
jgi:hypothetical protein